MFPHELFNDPGFRDLAEGPQRLFMWLWIHPDLNGAGVIAIQAKEWAAACRGVTEEAITRYAKSLRYEGWVDYDDGQLWLRPYMKFDGALKSQTVYVGVTRAIKTVRSRRLRETIWQLFRTFPKPISPIPAYAEDPEGTKTKKIAALNASVEKGYAELEQHMTMPGVRESLLPIPPPDGIEGVSRGSVGVGVDGGSEHTTDDGELMLCSVAGCSGVAGADGRCADCVRGDRW
jgi:hypothetical protein